jgi:hypothetical protein
MSSTDDFRRDGVLAAGDPLDHPLFAVLWRARMS